jgi:hypothetical protein
VGRTPTLAMCLALTIACATKARTTKDAAATQPPASSPTTQAQKPTEPAAAAPSEKPAAARPAVPIPPAQPEEPTTAKPAVPAAASGSAPPADHVKDKHGVMHKRGSKRPFGDCTDCHGKELRGDGPAPSCYSCHGKKWHQGGP